MSTGEQLPNIIQRLRSCLQRKEHCNVKWHANNNQHKSFQDLLNGLKTNYEIEKAIEEETTEYKLMWPLNYSFKKTRYDYNIEVTKRTRENSYKDETTKGFVK